jgi:hypothetical protein
MVCLLIRLTASLAELILRELTHTERSRFVGVSGPGRREYRALDTSIAPMTFEYAGHQRVFRSRYFYEAWENQSVDRLIFVARLNEKRSSYRSVPYVRHARGFHSSLKNYLCRGPKPPAILLPNNGVRTTHPLSLLTACLGGYCR